MSRFLLAFVRNTSPNAGIPYSQQVFKVSNECTASDVTVPMNTIYFTFVKANVETAKELAESFVTLQIGNEMVVTSSITMIPENNGKRYWIGKLIPIGDIHGIYNEHTKNIIPFTRLVGNDEIIDL